MKVINCAQNELIHSINALLDYRHICFGLNNGCFRKCIIRNVLFKNVSLFTSPHSIICLLMVSVSPILSFFM